MDQASRIVVTLLSLCAIAAAGNTNFFSQNSPNAVSAAKEIRRTPGNGFDLFLHACFVHQLKRTFSSWKQYKVIANTM